MNTSLIFDVDGTLIDRGVLFEGLKDKLNLILALDDISVYIVSNNTSRSLESTYIKLLRLGLNLSIENIITPQVVLTSYLKKKEITRIFLIANADFTNSMKEQAPDIDLNSKSPQAVVVGFDTDLTYNKVAEIREFMFSGTPLWSLHTDIFCPDGDLRLPDCGSIVKFIETAYDVKSELDFGKPGRLMTNYLSELLTENSTSYYIGDRFSIDMKFADALGIQGVYVETGDKDDHPPIESKKYLRRASSLEFLNTII